LRNRSWSKVGDCWAFKASALNSQERPIRLSRRPKPFNFAVVDRDQECAVHAGERAGGDVRGDAELGDPGLISTRSRCGTSRTLLRMWPVRKNAIRAADRNDIEDVMMSFRMIISSPLRLHTLVVSVVAFQHCINQGLCFVLWSFPSYPLANAFRRPYTDTLSERRPYWARPLQHRSYNSPNIQM
jgi:hypothetical protein